MAIGSSIILRESDDFESGGISLVKSEWGTKRECTECGARFYDLVRNPVVCPKCDSIVTPEETKPSRGDLRTKAKNQASRKKNAVKIPVEPSTNDTAVENDDDPEALLKAAGIEDNNSEEGNEEDSSLIEGGFDIEESNDVSDVVETSGERKD